MPPPQLDIHVSANLLINPFAAGVLQGWTAPFQSAAPAPVRRRGPSRSAASGSAAAANFPGKRQLFLLPWAPPSRGRAPVAPSARHCGGPHRRL